MEGLYIKYQHVVNSVSICETENVLCASITKQRLYLFRNGKNVKTYKMSSSRLPQSCKEDSLGTPWGLHEVSERIGTDAPMGTVFEGRKSIGLIASECSKEKQEKNLITTRILRLRGLQQGINRGQGIDSFDRYIYIHGTNHEDRLGNPSSSGCLQLSNLDVIDLYESISDGTHLWIEQT